MEQTLIKLIEYYRMKVDRDHGYENNTPEYIVDDFINAQRENSNVSDNKIQEKNCSSCKWQYAKYEYKCESCCAGDDQYEFEQFD